MIAVSAAFRAAIAANELKLAEIYDFALANGSTVRLTTHTRDLIWNVAGDTYTSFPMKRGDINRNTDGEFDEYSLTLGNISGPFYDKVHKGALESATVTLRRVRWDTSYAADEQIPVFVGKPDVAFNSKVLSITNREVLGTLNVVVPRSTFQEACNWRVFDPTCGLTQSDYAYSGTATGGTGLTLTDTTRGTLYKVDFDGGDSSNPISRGETATGGAGAGTGVVVQIVYLTASTGTIWYAEQGGVQFVDDEVLTAVGDTVTVNGTPAEDTTFYEQGELEMTGGDNSGHRRPILVSSGGTDTVFWPFITDIAAGDTYKVYPGCDGRGATCRDTYGNLPPWRGYPFVPRAKDALFGERLGY